jgi:GTP-binding protein
MEIKSAEFVKSSPSIQDLPGGDLPEFAFIGRSNVGKSSLLNFLVGRKNLAKTSSTPGRTKLINHFLINDSCYFVDLPGYGFAKSSKTERVKWGQSTEQYLLQRSELKCLFVLLDLNVPPRAPDFEFLSWLRVHGVPIAVVLTKTDKLNQSARYRQEQLFGQELGKILDVEDRVFQTSVVKRKGREPILEFIKSKLVLEA